MKIYHYFIVCLTLTQCSSKHPRDFAVDSPQLDPMAFFTGHTRSTGVMENRAGAPVKKVTTHTQGTWRAGTLRIEQELRFDNAPVEHRSWLIQRIDAHHVEATANDMVGTAKGETYGPVFHWDFILATRPGNPLGNVRMSQWMYLQPNGETLVNHTTISKWGVVLRQVTEQFQKVEP